MFVQLEANLFPGQRPDRGAALSPRIVGFVQGGVADLGGVHRGPGVHGGGRWGRGHGGGRILPERDEG